MSLAMRAAWLVCAGILAGWCGLPTPVLALCALVAAVCFTRRAWRAYGVALLLVCAAWARWEVVTGVEPLAVEAGTPVQIAGVVLERVERASRTDLRVRGWMRAVGTDGAGEAVHTTLLAAVRGGADPAVRYGSEVELTGAFESPPVLRNPGGFDYGQYLARRDVHGILRVADGGLTVTGVGGRWTLRVLGRVRARVLRILDAGLDPPYDALAAGILLGERRSIPDDILDAFRDGGVIHVLVVSGANFALLVGAAYVLLAALRIPLTAVYVGTMLMAVAFAAMVGPQPPVLRALLVCLVYLGARLLERGSSAMNALAVSVTILLLWNPYSLFDAGFQLSYAATGGLLYFAPRWMAALAPIGDRVSSTWLGRKVWTGVVGATVVTIAVQLCTTPVTLYHFQRVSVAGFVSNLPVGIIVAGATVCALVTTAVGFVSLTASSVLTNSVWVLLAALVRVVEYFAESPYAVLLAPRAVAPFLAVYLFLVLTITHFGDVRRRVRQWGVVGLAAASCSVWAVALTEPLRVLTVTFLDVGQGDATVVQCPDGTTVVVDGGNRTRATDYGEAVVVPHLLSAADTRIEHVVMTHGDMDHRGGLPYIVSALRADSALGVSQAAAGADIRGAAARVGSDVGYGAGRTLAAGTARGERFSVEIVYPRAAGDVDTLDADANADSLVLLVRYGAFRALLTADIEADVESYLAQAAEEGWVDISAHILKTPHHGSASSSTPRFLDAVGATATVVSVGARNTHGHPAPSVLDRYAARHVDILRTDLHGAITVTTDGHRCWVRRTVN